MARKRQSKPQPAEPGVPLWDGVPKGYEEFLGQLKERIRTAQIKAALAVNKELIRMALG